MEFTDQEHKAIDKAIQARCEEAGVECYGIECIEEGRVWFWDSNDETQEAEWSVE